MNSRAKRAYKTGGFRGYHPKQASFRPKRGGVVMADAKIMDWIKPRRGEQIAVHQAWMANAGRVLQQHGNRERIRRMTQIALGQLKVENGLMVQP